jgi:hypothetical protein
MNVVRTAPHKTSHVNALLSTSSSGDNTVVAAITNAKIRVLSVAVVATLANVVTFKSGASTAISAAFPLGANGGIVLPFNEHGWFETAAGEALVINMGTATATGVQVQYVRIPTSV